MIIWEIAKELGSIQRRMATIQSRLIIATIYHKQIFAVITTLKPFMLAIDSLIEELWATEMVFDQIATDTYVANNFVFTK